MANAVFDYPTAAAPSTTVTIANFEQFPLDRIPEQYQSKLETGGGNVKTQDLGLSVTYIKINTSLISAADYASLFSFFKTTVNSMEKTFSYTDELGTVYNNVRLIKPSWYLSRVTSNSDAQYEGSFLMKTDPA